MDRILTAVRVRPLSEREIEINSIVIVEIDENINNESEGKIIIIDPVFYKKNGVDRRPYERQFNFDHSFWSASNSKHFADQIDIFDKLCSPQVIHCMNGLNCSIIAYGQTASGKTYTMMGNNTGEQTGVIPRVCQGLITASHSAINYSESTGEDVEENKTRVLSVNLSLSYYEIYNEKVHDLLSLSPEISCRIRESKDEGAFVENLTRRDFKDYNTVAQTLEEGNRRRIVASTLMNSASSRSHAVLTVYANQQLIPSSSCSSNNSSNSSSNSSGTSDGSSTDSITIVSRQSKVIKIPTKCDIVDVFYSILAVFYIQ